MIDPDLMLGIQKADHDGMKEVKVKLPVKHLLKLHYMKLTSGRTFSDVITTALYEYFQTMDASQGDAQERDANGPIQGAGADGVAQG